ncbi:hypothetical protein FQN60_004527 [Etheostoma spectabile]|uniref:Uncharacterized protein n=1 Tax=Etheostoma spectabile TaxID=54343 RepID=A0A5J5CCA5_9PERO|nr:hypothetical protein FQN60_004527 [Etheostoma spectabile]
MTKVDYSSVLCFQWKPALTDYSGTAPFHPTTCWRRALAKKYDPETWRKRATQTLRPLFPHTTTSRRHTLAEVSARFHQCNPPCIVVSPSDGASSDSCLKSSSSPAPTLQAAIGEMSTLLASESGTLLPAGAPQTFSSHLQPQAQGSLPSASFQEGRRASDTSLTQGLKAFRQQLRKSTRTKGLLGLNKIKGLTRQVVVPPSCNRGSRGSLGPALSEHRMLEESKPLRQDLPTIP